VRFIAIRSREWFSAGDCILDPSSVSVDPVTPSHRHFERRDVFDPAFNFRMCSSESVSRKQLAQREGVPLVCCRSAVGKTGAGLAIACLLVVVKHADTVDFEYAVGEGQTSRIRLPLEKAMGPIPCVS